MLMKNILLIVIVLSFGVSGVSMGQTQIYTNRIEGFTAAQVDAGLPANHAFDPTTIASAIVDPTYSVSNGPASPHGGNAYFGSVVGAGGVGDYTVDFADFVDINGAPVSFLDQESYVVTIFYKPSIVSDNLGNSWSYIPDSNIDYYIFDGAPVSIGNTVASFSPNTWTAIDFSFVFDAATMGNSPYLWVTPLYVLTPLQGSAALAQSNFNYNGAIDIGAPVAAVPEPSGAILIGVAGLLGILQRRRSVRA
ncbi:PEP-CTERM sorting domain-containing protein [Phragmitibacter flavus]|uniref:PEP-CTERM sorting domain-containing protein n=1 Tax=Phragmitibacter flavus TaxID=2576071 RepID=A0A5R8KGM5_9BACT|nr:PEP-CTERM sorting domain-containing protein [Phragmitibacter flavus]TLD71115.1 PEP-CTERM sorting domain-containing protein [Phragmitibacter flavus]